MKIYISGKISGLDIKLAEAKFQEFEDVIVKAGHEAVNPMKLVPYSPKLTWHDYMKADIKALVDCDAIVMMDNWKDSKGAVVEHDLAKALEIKIIY